MWRFKKLRILFLSNNNFTVFPACLAPCPALEMIGFKANRITDISEHAFPKQLRWLILTDNKITKILERDFDDNLVDDILTEMVLGVCEHQGREAVHKYKA